jgi:polyisoprenoid-binding protein YceI
MRFACVKSFLWGLLSCSLSLQGITSELLVNSADSEIDVAVHATGADFVAKLAAFESKISFADSNSLPTSASIGWDFADLNTGKKGRDKEMLRWLHHAETPRGRFVMTKCELKDGSVAASGQLTMHDAVRDVSIPMKMVRDGNRVAFEGTVTLDHRDFGLPKIVKLAVLKVEPVLTVHFKIAGTVQ